jgi:hypothetical protein
MPTLGIAGIRAYSIDYFIASLCIILQKGFGIDLQVRDQWFYMMNEFFISAR